MVLAFFGVFEICSFHPTSVYNEHNNPTKSSEPSKHLRSNINHYFTWAVISNAPKNAKTRKNLEASYIALWKPDLNEQKDFERLVLFTNDVT